MKGMLYFMRPSSWLQQTILYLVHRHPYYRRVSIELKGKKTQIAEWGIQ